jgi:outer membrane protein TolC
MTHPFARTFLFVSMCLAFGTPLCRGQRSTDPSAQRIPLARLAAVDSQARPAKEPSVSAISLMDAVQRARANNQLIQSALLNKEIAREGRNQARASFLPDLAFNNQFVYTQGNGTLSGVFISNDGVHVYNSQGVIHVEPLSLSRVAEYRQVGLEQAIAEAKAEILARGLVAAVAENYYALVVAQRHASNAQQSVAETQQFLDLTAKMEAGGEVAHADVIKAQIVVEQRQRDLEDAQLAIEKSRIGLGVLIFPDFRTDFTVVDDLQSPKPLGPIDEIQALVGSTSPELQAAQMALKQEAYGVKAAKNANLPSLSFDWWYGINANQFAINGPEGRNLGNSAQVTLNIPLWNWGVARSKVRQAELRQRQAQLDLSLAQKEAISQINSLHAEARSAFAQLDSLRHSVDLAAESLRLILLRYRAGEVSALEVVDAQSTVSQARNAYDDGLSRYRVIFANIQTLTGTL